MNIELKKLEVELSRVATAKMEMELRIEERQLEIANLQKNMAIQDARVIELNEMIRKLKENK